MKTILNILIASLMILSSSAILATTGLEPVSAIGVSVGLAVVMTAAKEYIPAGINLVTVCGELSADISKSCTNPLQAGTRDRGIVINFEDILAPVYAADGETVVDLTLSSGAVGYVIDGQNNSIEPKCSMVEQGFNNMFDHEVMMKGFDISPATKNQVNSMKDGRFVIITENYFRGASGDAAFEVYGLTTGLELTEIERDANSEETQGAFHFKFFTKKNKEAKVAATFYLTDYTTTKALVDALLV